MWYNTRGRLDKYPKFKEKIYGIFRKDRASEMKEDSFEKLQKYIEVNSVQNEATFFGRLVEKIVKEDRLVETKKRTAENEIVMLSRSFEDDDLADPQRDKKFTKGFLPTELDTSLGLTDPKPDFTFGMNLRSKYIQGQAPSQNVRVITEVCPGICHPFFFIEGKGISQPIDVARNQAIRDGAALVNARRQLNRLSRNDDYQECPGPDEESFCFSCTWDTNLAELWVHWHEMAEDGYDIFHMHRLELYVMVDRIGELRTFRADIHNVLDWGILINAKACEAKMAEIRSREIRVEAERKAETERLGEELEAEEGMPKTKGKRKKRGGKG